MRNRSIPSEWHNKQTNQQWCRLCTVLCMEQSHPQTCASQFSEPAKIQVPLQRAGVHPHSMHSAFKNVKTLLAHTPTNHFTYTRHEQVQTCNRFAFRSCAFVAAHVERLDSGRIVRDKNWALVHFFSEIPAQKDSQPKANVGGKSQ